MHLVRPLLVYIGAVHSIAIPNSQEQQKKVKVLGRDYPSFS